MYFLNRCARIQNVYVNLHFISGGKTYGKCSVYVSSKYYNVSEEKIKKVTKALDHFTKINRETKNACEKITLITFLTEVNRIIIGK